MPYTPQTQPKDERGRFAPTGDAGADRTTSDLNSSEKAALLKAGQDWNRALSTLGAVNFDHKRGKATDAQLKEATDNATRLNKVYSKLSKPLEYQREQKADKSVEPRNAVVAKVLDDMGGIPEAGTSSHQLPNGKYLVGFVNSEDIDSADNESVSFHIADTPDGPAIGETISAEGANWYKDEALLGKLDSLAGKNSAAGEGLIERNQVKASSYDGHNAQLESRMPDSERYPTGYKNRAEWEASDRFKQQQEKVGGKETTQANLKGYAEQVKAQTQLDKAPDRGLGKTAVQPAKEFKREEVFTHYVQKNLLSSVQLKNEADRTKWERLNKTVGKFEAKLGSARVILGRVTNTTQKKVFDVYARKMAHAVASVAAQRNALQK